MVKWKGREGRKWLMIFRERGVYALLTTVVERGEVV